MMTTATVNPQQDVLIKNQQEFIAPTVEAPSGCCHHYWLIERANGPLSHAVCKYCDEERNFSNLPVHNDEIKVEGSAAKQGFRTRSFSPYEFTGGRPHQPFSGNKQAPDRSN